MAPRLHTVLQKFCLSFPNAIINNLQLQLQSTSVVLNFIIIIIFKICGPNREIWSDPRGVWPHLLWPCSELSTFTYRSVWLLPELHMHSELTSMSVPPLTLLTRATTSARLWSAGGKFHCCLLFGTKTTGDEWLQHSFPRLQSHVQTYIQSMGHRLNTSGLHWDINPCQPISKESPHCHNPK